jgi:hypothetical protein
MIAVRPEFVNVPAAPAVGAANVTFTDGTGLPYWSVTAAAMVTGKRVPTAVLWGVPAEAVIELAAAALLVRANTAELAPVALATT